MTDRTADGIEEALAGDGVRSRRKHRVAWWHAGPADELSKMVDIRQSQSIRNIFHVGSHFADGSYIFGFQAIGYAHLVQVGIAREREDGRILVFPAKLPYSVLSGRLENRHLNRLALNQAIALTGLSGSNCKVRLIAGGLYEAISQRIEHGA